MDFGDPGWWKFALDVIQSIILLAVVVYGFVVSRTAANRREIDSVGAKITDVSHRVAQIETKMASLNGVGGEIRDIHARVTNVQTEMNHLGGQLKVISNTLHLLHEKQLNE